MLVTLLAPALARRACVVPRSSCPHVPPVASASSSPSSDKGRAHFTGSYECKTSATLNFDSCISAVVLGEQAASRNAPLSTRLGTSENFLSGKVLIKSGRALGPVVYTPRVVDYGHPSARDTGILAIANGLSPAIAGLATGDLLRVDATEKTTLGIFVSKRCRLHFARALD